MSILGVLFSAGIVVGLFSLLRRMSRWLHQHIFKVGWLLSKLAHVKAPQDMKFATALYLVFFLPGVALHEFTVYVVAGLLNVNATQQVMSSQQSIRGIATNRPPKRRFQWPELQDIGELKLNFVRINRGSPLRRTAIALSPLIVGLVLVYFAAVNIFNVPALLDVMGSGDVRDLGRAWGIFVNTPDVWLWLYLTFTVANTMFPSMTKDLQGWQNVLLTFGAVSLLLVIIGIGGAIFSALADPFGDLLRDLTLILGMMIVFDAIATGLLSLIENTIEQLSGHSATFKKGRMVTMTREEAAQERERDAARRAGTPRRELGQSQSTKLATIYQFTWPVPGPPGRELFGTQQKAMFAGEPSTPMLKPMPPSIGSFAGQRADASHDGKSDEDEEKHHPEGDELI